MESCGPKTLLALHQDLPSRRTIICGAWRRATQRLDSTEPGDGREGGELLQADACSPEVSHVENPSQSCAGGRRARNDFLGFAVVISVLGVSLD